MVEVSSLSLAVTHGKKRQERLVLDDSNREGEKKPNTPPSHPQKQEKRMWAAVNCSRRKQSAFPEGFGEHDAVISAYLNSLTTAIKTKIQSATSCLVKTCL